MNEMHERVFAEAGMSLVRLFTPREANETLPLVKRIVEDVNQTGRRLRQRVAELRQEAQGDSEIRKMADELSDLFDELQSLGCSYKDWGFEMGLVDFPAVIDGEEVLLCWRSDEPSVRFYHGLYAGFVGRKPIPEDFLEAEEAE